MPRYQEIAATECTVNSARSPFDDISHKRFGQKGEPWPGGRPGTQDDRRCWYKYGKLHEVFSIDLRPELVEAARDRIATMGYLPVLRAVDGSSGLPEHAPYDRIIATCSVAAIPGEWIEQTVPGGLILVDVEGQLSAGNLVLLRRGDEPVAEGKFLDWYGRFMALRHDVASVGHAWPAVDRSQGEERTTAVDSVELDGGFRFLAQFRTSGHPAQPDD